MENMLPFSTLYSRPDAFRHLPSSGALTCNCYRVVILYICPFCIFPFYIYIYMLFCHHMAGGGQVRNQWISGLFGYTQHALTCRIYLAGSVETFTSVKRRCHASRTCFAVSKLQCTFNSWDLSAHRLYRPCGPARTRIVWSALALKKSPEVSTYNSFL